MSKSSLTSQSVDFPGWYQEILSLGELVEHGPVRGTMVIRPYGFALWELLQAELDTRIKSLGVSNVYMPLFIPESYLEREAEHVEGFSPELAVVTHAGSGPLEEPIVVRPTSETVFGEYMSRWIQSYRDLPLLLNQWANVVRWELRPRLFLRTSEFLWQEGHTAHASRDEARQFASLVLSDVYATVMRDALAIPVVLGLKPPSERFAGATNTMTCEALMADGKALQMGTSHELGQNFAEAFSMYFTSDDSKRRLCWTTSWGVSTRLIGGIVMCHGDDRGLRIPPVVAPIQVVVLQLDDSDEVATAASRLEHAIRERGARSHLDGRTEQSFGRRATEWELKGVPVRIAIGRRELEAGRVELVVRGEATRSMDLVAAPNAFPEVLRCLHDSLLSAASARQSDRMAATTSIEEAVEATEEGWATIPWAEVEGEGEARLNAEGRTVRCLVTESMMLPASLEEVGLVAVVGRAY